MNEAQKQKKEQLQKQDMFSNISFVQEAGKKASLEPLQVPKHFHSVNYMLSICSALVRRARCEAFA